MGGKGREVKRRAGLPIFHLRLIRRYKVSLFVYQRNSSGGGNMSNVNSKDSKLIPSRANDCADAHASGIFRVKRYFAFIKAPASFNVNPVSQSSSTSSCSGGKEREKENIRFSHRAILHANYVVSFLLLDTCFPCNKCNTCLKRNPRVAEIANYRRNSVLCFPTTTTCQTEKKSEKIICDSIFSDQFKNIRYLFHWIS